MPRVLIAGGGLAGLSAAAALGSAGYQVDLFEARSFLGGRATSYPVPGGSDVIDNCQHVLLACFRNLLNLYERLGVRDRIRFHEEFRYIEPGGRASMLRAGLLPPPLHFFGSFARLRFLSASDKLAVARGLRAIAREHATRGDLDRITMLEWLKEKRQTPRAIERFWRQVLVSAINEELGRMPARYGFQVFRLGFLARPDAYHMGLPTVPLGELYGTGASLPGVTLHLKSPVERILVESGSAVAATADGTSHAADYFICALPFERVEGVVPELALDLSGFEHSPITGIHLWFDRAVMSVPHATLLDRTVQWAFNRGEGRYVQLVASASRSLVPMSKEDVVALALRELAEFFPAAREARLVRSHVVKEVRATFSAVPGLDRSRPPAATSIPNLFLAGDWTRTGWPATMEGAVRSGYLAAEAVTAAAGPPRRFLVDA